MSTVITVGGALFDNSVTDAKLRDSVALSVIGRATNSSGDPTDIVASSDGDILRRSGTTLGFGAIPESSVTGLVGDLAAIEADIAALPTGSGTANTITKWTSSSALGDSALTDDGTTFAINVNKFTVVEASGNTTIAGTADVIGDFKVNTNKFTVTASSGNTLVAGTLTVSSLTAASVPFIGTSGLLSQDNTNFTWDNTNKTLTVQSSASYALAVVATSTNDPLRIQNMNAAGASTMYMTDSAGTIKVSFGYANSSFAGGILTSRAFVWRNGPDFVFQNQSGAIDAMLFSGGNWNFGSTATDPGVKVRVQGAFTATGDCIFGTGDSNRHTANGGLDVKDAVGTTFAGLDSLTASPLAVWDTTALATGVGGGILFLGKYTSGGGYAGAAGIKMMKENATDGNYSFALALGTRANGGSLTEQMRISSGGNVGIGASPTVRLEVVDATANATVGIVRSTVTTGYAALNYHDSSNNLKGGVGYANASIPANTHIASKMYLYGTVDWVFANNTRNEIQIGMTSGSTFVQHQNGSGSAVSDANTGRIRYNTTGQKYQLSANGASYVDFVSVVAGGGTANTIPKWSASGVLADSLVTDDGTTFAINTNKFTVTEASGNTLVAGTLTVSPMTSGSVLFAGTSGVVSQDNTNFAWNNTTKTLTLIASANNYALVVKGQSATDPLGITNTSASGPSSVFMTDTTGSIKVSFGYGNSSAAAPLTSRAFIWRNGPDLVFSRQNTSSPDGMIFYSGNWNIGSSTSDPSVKLRVEGNITVGADTASRHTANGGWDSFETIGTTLASIDSLTTPNFACYDTSGVAAGVGGGILFLGKWTGSSYVGASAIKTMKVNSTDGHYAFDLVLGSRANGSGSITENLRLLSTGGASITGALSSTGDFAVNTNKFTVASSSGNTLVAGTLTVTGAATLNGAVAIGDNAADAHSLTGTLNANSTAGTNGQVMCIQSGVPQWATLSTISGVTGTGSSSYLTKWNGPSSVTTSNFITEGAVDLIFTNCKVSSDYTPTAFTASATAVYSSAAGTYNTTSGALTATAIEGSATATRSSGANDLTCRGARFSASGGQVNIALQTSSGEVRLDGNTTLGTSSAGAHTINGKITFSNTATAGPVLYGALSARMFLGRQIFTSSGTYTPSTGTKAVFAVGVGGGGGGGGAGGGGNRSVGAGGGSGVYWEKWIDSAANTTGGTVTIGAAGSAGASTGGTGGTGGDTSFVVDGTTYTVKGGTGGVGTASGTGSAALPGAPQTGSTSGADRLAGEHGELGIVVDSAAVQIGGHGGSNPFGIGGAAGGAGNTVAVGADGTGRGAGGGGANAQGTGKAGGAGTAGCVIFYEFA
jgi:hypothetical protein